MSHVGDTVGIGALVPRSSSIRTNGKSTHRACATGRPSGKRSITKLPVLPYTDQLGSMRAFGNIAM